MIWPLCQIQSVRLNPDTERSFQICLDDDVTPQSLPAMQNIVVVLTEPQDLVNIAGTARAMLNMGVARLRLVNPAEFDAYRITGIAHGSDELVATTQFFGSLGEAVADAAHVVGTSARR